MAPSSSPLFPSPSKKLLITDPKPKPIPGPQITPLNSASSSSTTTIPPPEKRTRDQPNLSDCHCCARRINHINTNDRLQPLDSIWRIVLLCRKCRKKLNSGQTCPYCFQETENSNDLFKCTVCQRKIHKDCARDYRNCTPWCYLGLGLGIRVCVDCWVPDSLKNSIRVCGRSENKGACKYKGDYKDCSEKTGKDAKCDMEKKAKKTAKAKEQALRKDTVGNCANHALDSVTKKDRNDQKGGISDCSDEIEVSDDAELAFQLHRAMNSSPRILRGKCYVNSCLDVLKCGDSNGISHKRSGLGGDQSEGQSANSMDNERINWTGKNSLCSDINGSVSGPLTYKRNRKRKVWHTVSESAMVSESRSSQLEEVKFKLHLTDSRIGSPIRWDGNILETLVCVNADQSGSCINIDRFGQEPVVYKRTRFRRKVCQENGVVECSSCDNQGLAFKLQNRLLDDIKHKLPLVDTRTDCLVEGDTKVILRNGSCNVEGDRYFLKYGKRVTGTKSGPTRMCSGCLVKGDTEVILPNGSCNVECDRHFLKYGKRVTGTKSGSTRVFSDCPVKGDTEVILPNGGCNAERDRYFLKYGKRVTGTQSGPTHVFFDCPVKGDTEVILPNGSCNAERDRYFLKYGKRVTDTKSGPTHMCYDTFQSENQPCAPCLSKSGTGNSAKCDGKFTLPNGSSDEEPDRYCFKYVKRVKGSHSGSIVETNLHSDVIQNIKQASAPGLTRNCSAESRTVSDISFESFTIDLSK